MTIFPQIAIAIGVLTSNRGAGRRTTLADWTWHQGAIAGCSGLWLGGRVTAKIGGVDVPLQGAIVVCYGLGEGDDQFWGSGRGAIAGCVPWAPCTAMASRKNIQKNCLELLADVTLFSTLITQRLVLAIWALCWYN